MDDLGPETRQLLDQARDGERLTDNRRRAIRHRLAGALGLGATMGVSAVASGATTVSFALIRAVGVLGLVGAVGAGAVESIDSLAPQRLSRTAPILSARPARSSASWSSQPAHGSLAQATDAVQSFPFAVPSSSSTVESNPPASANSPGPTASKPPLPPLLAKATITTRVAPPPFAGAQAGERPVSVAPVVASDIPPPHRAADPLATEAHLIADAQRALSRGNAERASALLDEHEEHFPAGSFEPERSALRVDLLCAAGRIEEARAAAARFRIRHPGSPLTHRWRATCAGDDPTAGVRPQQ
jgi:hypothetical protein